MKTQSAQSAQQMIRCDGLGGQGCQYQGIELFTEWNESDDYDDEEATKKQEEEKKEKEER